MKSIDRVSRTPVHAAAARRFYLFVDTSFENALVAFVPAGAALALEAVAAVSGRDKAAHQQVPPRRQA